MRRIARCIINDNHFVTKSKHHCKINQTILQIHHIYLLTNPFTAMVSSRNRSSASASELAPSKLTRSPLAEWTIREKLTLASLAIKTGNSWNSVARQMQNLAEKSRPDGYFNQKTCAAQFDKLMNELGVDKRPKRNEPSDGNSSTVIYRKMAEKRAKELEEDLVKLRKSFIAIENDLTALNDGSLPEGRITELKQKLKPSSQESTQSPASASTETPIQQATTTSSKTPNRSSISSSNESEKPPTRALTRRESSRQNLEKTLAILCKEASEIKSLNLLIRPASDDDKELYDNVILNHVDLSVIKKRLGGEVDDPYAVMNDLLLMFQNATMFYPTDHQIHKNAVALRDKLVPQWERALLEKHRPKH